MTLPSELRYMPFMTQDTQRALCIDLDGTLTLTDTLWESIFRVIRHAPRHALALPFWALRGRAYFKARVADIILPDVKHLPYHSECVDLARKAQKAGRRTMLVTAADQRIADAVAQQLGCFDEAVGSTAARNLKSAAKRDFLNERFGAGNYDYAGNSSADLPIWEDAHEAIIVNASARTTARAQRVNSIHSIHPGPQWTVHTLRRLLRVHQWSKNVLIFLPLLLAHQLGNIAAWQDAFTAFAAFAACASAIYIINDLLDLPADRAHPTKHRRPLASGECSIPVGLAVCIALLTAGITLAASQSSSLLILMAGYLVITTTYSVWLKHKLMIDVVCLAMLYTVRVLAGEASTGIEISQWLLVFVVFFFLSLACAKRYIELITMYHTSNDALGRSYTADDRVIMAIIGIASGFSAIFTFALYVGSTQALQLYAHPKYLWGIMPLLIYWLGRTWLLAHRGKIHADPTVFVLTDRASYAVAACIALLVLGAAL